MDKKSIPYLISFIAYLTIFLFDRMPNLFESFKTIILRLSTENAYFLSATLSFVSLYFVLFLLYLFIFFKEDYQNKLTFSASIVNLIVIIPQLLYIASPLILGEEFFFEGNPGYGVALIMAFIVYPYIIIPLILISTVLLIIGIVKGRKNVGEETSSLKVILILFLFITTTILYPSLIISLLLLILTIVMDNWRYMFFYALISLISIIIILLLLRFIQKKVKP